MKLRPFSDHDRGIYVNVDDPGGVGKGAIVHVAGPRQWLMFPAGQSAAPLVAAVAERYPLVDLSVREPDIEDVIAKLYAGGRSGAA